MYSRGFRDGAEQKNPIDDVLNDLSRKAESTAWLQEVEMR